MLKQTLATALLLLLLPLAGCGLVGGNSMKDIATKAEKAKTREQLEAALGKPDKFEKVKFGVALESWTYTATDGEVNFTIVNDRIQATVTVPKKEQKQQHDQKRE